MAVIKIRNSGETLDCPAGTNLLQLLVERGIYIENPCSGRGVCGKCRVRLCAGVFSDLTQTERALLKEEERHAGVRLACMTEVLGDGEVELLHRRRKHEVLSGGYCPPFERDECGDGYGVAVDIGTTTVVLSLIDLRSGETRASASDVNAQRAYGLDVLTRISYEYEQGEAGIRRLQTAIVTLLNTLLKAVCAEAAIGRDEIREIVVAANCAMTHMLLGADARGLGRAPYEPAFHAAQCCLASDIGLAAGEKTRLYCLPQVSAFIGGDIVAGICVCGLQRETGNVLFIDIGTNGEIVLASRGKLLSCSCAAGPALEGMNIRCGMRAAEGAVEDVRITDEGVELTTIAGAPPEGLCGSGILAAVRELVRHGFVKKTGAYLPVAAQPAPAILRLDGTKREAVLCAQPEIVVTQDDIRQVQLAKGAILSGLTVLLQRAGIGMEELDRVIIAGQFGSHLPAESLCGIGLLPEQVRDKLAYVGNSSRSGAVMALLSGKKRREMEEIAKRVDYIDLTRTEEYDRVFSAAMAFPAPKLGMEKQMPGGTCERT